MEVGGSVKPAKTVDPADIKDASAKWDYVIMFGMYIYICRNIVDPLSISLFFSFFWSYKNIFLSNFFFLSTYIGNMKPPVDKEGHQLAEASDQMVKYKKLMVSIPFFASFLNL